MTADGRRGSRQPRADVTRAALLEAARAVFAEQGYAAASVAEVVRLAGASVGALYHHFGGKVDLFLALWEEHRLALERAATEAVAERRREGEGEPLALFLAGARAYLESCRARRDTAALFLAGDGPPGFELLRRRNTREWLRQNTVLLRLDGRPAHRAKVAVLTTAIGEIGREVVQCSEGEVRELTDTALELITRVFAVPD